MAEYILVHFAQYKLGTGGFDFEGVYGPFPTSTAAEIYATTELKASKASNGSFYDAGSLDDSRNSYKIQTLRKPRNGTTNVRPDEAR